MDILLDSFWMVHHDTAARAKKDAVLLALTKQTLWLADIHLEFLTTKEAAVFVRHLALKGLDGLFVTGDISTANRIEDHLQMFAELYKALVYFLR
jgi:hypothetical protein